ncbi:phage major capsid protein [Glutamicibacter sp. TV12E]|uniref:phage major capsid protein n=1 Tax=Glutamicibacter sp. TV12E TaxID=3446362 RepID=UPI0040345902
MAQSFTSTPALLPKEMTNSILLKAYEASVVGRLAGGTPQKFGETAIPIYEGQTELGLVGETQAYGTSTVSTGMQYLTNRKFGTIVVVSKELIENDPEQILDKIEDDLVSAGARAYDSIFLAGKDGRGAAITGQSHINQTTKRIELAASPDYKAAIEAGIEAVSADYDVTGLAFDNAIKIKLASLVNETQVGFADLSTSRLTIAGFNAEGARTVGKAGNRLIVGDWTKLRAGFSEDIKIERSDQAVVGGVSMWETDQVALKVSMSVAGTVLDPNAFAVIEDGTA